MSLNIQSTNFTIRNYLKCVFSFISYIIFVHRSLLFFLIPFHLTPLTYFIFNQFQCIEELEYELYIHYGTVRNVCIPILLLQFDTL